MRNKVKQLKRKLLSSRADKSKRNKPDIIEPTTFTRYSGTYFSSVVKQLTPHQRAVIERYGAECMLKFEKTDVPLRFVKWIAGKFETRTSEIQVGKDFIPVTKESIHNILELPIGGLELIPDSQAGRSFILSRFNVTCIPQVSFFGNKLKSGEFLSDDDIFICFMSVAFQSFLCPNSSLQPSSEYLHIFREPKNVMKHDLSKYVYDWLIISIKKFHKATKCVAKRQITLGGNHYSLAVAYLDRVEFGLNSLPHVIPRLLVWKGNRIRQYADLDKYSANSYGKRPLKSCSYAYKIQIKNPRENFGKCSPNFEQPQNSLSNHGKSPLNSFPYAQGTQMKNSCEIFGECSPNVEQPQESFTNKLRTMFRFWLNDQQIQRIYEIVQMSIIGEGKGLQERCENVVLDVLNSIHASNQNGKSANTEGVITEIVSNNNSEAKCDTPTIKISANENETTSEQSFDIELTISKGKLASGKYQRLAKLLDSRDSDAQLIDDTNNDATHECKSTEEVGPKIKQAVPNKPEHIENIANTASSPPTPVCPVDIIDSQQLNSVSPMKKVKPKFKDFSSGNEDKAKTPIVVGSQDFESGDGNNNKAPKSGLSPIVPIALSHLFQEHQNSTTRPRENVQISSADPHQACIFATSARHKQNNVQYSVMHESNTINLCSPVCGGSQVYLVEDSPDQALFSDDVQITGCTKFDQRCNLLSKQANDAYNNLLMFNPMHSSKLIQNTQHQGYVHISQSSQEKEHENNLPTKRLKPSAQNLDSDLHLNNVDQGSASRSTGIFVPRRVLMPTRYISDPYVHKTNRFSVTPSERRYYSAMCLIGQHNEWKKDEAVRYDKAFCSFDSLGSLQPFGHVDNYVVLVYCRKLFLDCHPTVSKKHCFFSYIGFTILNYNGLNGDIVQNAFEGANKALKMWRADQMSFPICINAHWFVFVVCLKANYFAFLDSLYDADSDFHLHIDHTLIKNFVTLWNMYVAPLIPHPINFQKFQLIHPVVPRQGNTDDCGVFTMKIMDVWHPRAHLQNIFSKDDILNLRIKLANEIYFSKHNSLDKTVVSEFFGEVGM